MLSELPKDYRQAYLDNDNIDIDDPDDADITFIEFLDLMTPIWLLQLDQLRKEGWFNNNAS